MHKHRKRFGQHFLTDHFVIDRLIQLINPKPSEHFVEIGPGSGALTKKLLPITSELTVIEIDRDLILPLEQACSPLGTLYLHQGDALKFDFSLLNKHPLRLVGNLPYNISTPLLFHCLETLHLIQDMHFMLQKEVVDRMIAKPGNKTYGRLSVMVQYYCHAEKLFIVRPGAFHPPPKVDSAIIRLCPRKEREPLRDLKRFANLVNAAFQHRRKTLKNALDGYLHESQLQDAGIPPNTRAEQLSVQDFVTLSNLEIEL